MDENSPSQEAGHLQGTRRQGHRRKEATAEGEGVSEAWEST